MPLTDNLISFWELEEASGTRADSVVATGNDLSDNGTVTQAAGKVGNSGQFTATTSEFLNHVDNASLSLGAGVSFTVAAWVYLDSLPSFAMVASQLDHSTEESWQLYYYQAGDQFVFSISSDGTASGFTSVLAGSSITTGTWYYLVGWYDYPNNLNLQVNNGTPASVSLSNAAFNSSADFRIGARHSTPELFWDGRIDQVGFWKRALTSDERTNLYNSGNGLSYAAMTGGGGGGAVIPVFLNQYRQRWR